MYTSTLIRRLLLEEESKRTVRYETEPGEQAQVDFVPCKYIGPDGKTHRIWVFVMVLSWSRAIYVEFVKRADLATLVRCHINAFEHFGGVPRKCLYDNAKVVVLGRDDAGRAVFNERFTDFSLCVELAARRQRYLTARTRLAHLPYHKTLEQFDFSFQPSIDERQVRELATLAFVADAANVILMGPPGGGKTHLAVALGLKAIASGHGVYFVRAHDLLEDLRKAQAEHSPDRRMRACLAPKVLIIDEFGVWPYDRMAATAPFALISARYEKGSVILTMNASLKPKVDTPPKGTAEFDRGCGIVVHRSVTREGADDMDKRVPIAELKTRLERFRVKMDETAPDWRIAVVFSKINQYYFTGTMQDGMLLIPRDDQATYWVRRSYERALDESLFSSIRPMESFRDAVGSITASGAVHLETEVVSLAMYQRFHKYFPFDEVRSLDRQIAAVRAVKSPYELSLMEQSGKIHRRVLEERLPEVLREGMSEADLAAETFAILMEEGHHGLLRLAMFDTEIGLGQIGFGESSIYPTYFNGPGGNYGLSPAVPIIGSRERKLQKGDLVFVDAGCGVDGYHTDKTMTYVFGKPLPKGVASVHQRCVEIQNEIASMLKPGAIPSDIYTSVMSRLDSEFLDNFMGFGKRRVRFLGHGIGLAVDELPVIAGGFDEPLEEGMAFAIEPKKGIAGIGMVGIENTFLVTPEGGRCITGDNPGLIPVY